MKPRNTEFLIEFLASKQQIRKRELIALKSDLTRGKSEPKPQFKRTAIVLSYAHWEGFVKEAARAYVDFVTQKTRSLSSLASNFKALACRQELQVAQGATKKIGPHLSLVELLTKGAGKSVMINAENAIDTESNLDEKVFLNICQCIGIDFATSWEPRGPFMNDLFLSRCKIAHGEMLEPETKYAIEVIDAVIAWIQDFSTDIENAAVSGLYLDS
jgi:hypothetical protein